MKSARGFTLVEILLVVVILGILAALVVPQYTNATVDAKQTATLDQLTKIRRALEVYYVRYNGYPSVTAGDGTWAELIDQSTSNTYLRGAPVNSWVGGAGGTVISLGNTPDSAYQDVYGWIYDATTGQVWAASFDSNDQPLPRP